MKNSQENFIFDIKSALQDAASYYLNKQEGLWRLTDRGFLFNYFQSYNSNGEYIIHFYEKIEMVAKSRNKFCDFRGAQVSGRILLFDPSAAMYDGLSEELTDGFFDSDDVPPPEFWVGIKNGKLVAFIPSEFEAIANIGVENCMSGCLEWVTEELTVNL